jgi:hypothetical protein
MLLLGVVLLCCYMRLLGVVLLYCYMGSLGVVLLYCYMGPLSVVLLYCYMRLLGIVLIDFTFTFHPRSEISRHCHPELSDALLYFTRICSLPEMKRTEHRALLL